MHGRCFFFLYLWLLKQLFKFAPNPSKIRWPLLRGSLSIDWPLPLATLAKRIQIWGMNMTNLSKSTLNTASQDASYWPGKGCGNCTHTSYNKFWLVTLFSVAVQSSSLSICVCMFIRRKDWKERLHWISYYWK